MSADLVHLLPVPGARLATDVHLPAGGAPAPAVIIRTPYDRASHRAEARAWVAHGFAAVVQDVRGRHGSDGTWHPYRGEAADGAATLRWVRAQDWCDGRVVAAGSSYAAYCALVTAVGDDATPAPGTPPHTKPGAPPDRASSTASGPAPNTPSAYPSASPPDTAPDAVIAAVPALGPAEVAREPSGVERLYARAGWWAARGDRPDSDATALDKALAGDPGLLEHLPVTGLPDRLGRPMSSWPGVWDDCRRDRVILRGATAHVPLLAVGGARDPFVTDTMNLWRHWGGPSRLLVGPWGHGLTTDPAPEARAGHRVNLGALYASWARAALDGTQSEGTRGVVALGDSDRWYPLGGGPTTACLRHFVPPHGLRLLQGRAFLADPEHPVRSDHLDIDPHHAADRALLVTPPLPRPVDLLGAAEARLCAAADTPVADWFVRLVALDPHGRAAPLAVGAVRRADPAGTHVRFTVPLGFLARRLDAGTRLRVEIAGHHFPAHARNPHTGENPVTATRLSPSRRTPRTTGTALLLPAGLGRRTDPVTDLAQELCT
ncbi:CocE/NonD family hydrolase [Streptomyces sp. NPDC058001]|uniref:CocE/NonD family hydrolase n=1 Tax=Streptomyces sp. NPDC058001 TaxID=3346300 RepID=UPI0036ECD7DC